MRHAPNPSLKLDGATSLMANQTVTGVRVNGVFRQISNEDTIYCPECGEEILYWQTAAHYSTANFNEKE